MNDLKRTHFKYISIFFVLMSCLVMSPVSFAIQAYNQLSRIQSDSLIVSAEIESLDTPPYFNNLGFESVKLDRNEYPHVVYGGDHLYHTWFDGSKWQTETIDSSTGTGEFAALFIDKSGAEDVYHVVYMDGSKLLMKYATKTGHQAWQAEAINGASLYYWYPDPNPKIAVDSNGKAHIVYYRKSQYSAYLYYATNQSGSWVTQSVSSSANLGQLSSLELDAQNILHLVYSNKDSGSIDYATKSIDATGWTSARVAFCNNGSRAVCMFSMDKDATDNMHLIFYDHVSGGIKYAQKPSGSNSFEASQLIISGVKGSNFLLNVDPANELKIIYYDQTPINYWQNNTRLAHLYFDAATQTWKTYIVDNEGNVGSRLASTVDSSGISHVVYYDETRQRLKYATGQGTLWIKDGLMRDSEKGELVERLDVGLHTRLALDSQEHVHIIYYDEKNKNYKYSTNQNGSWELSLLPAISGMSTAYNFALNSKNKMYVVYYDGTARKLKVAEKNLSETTWSISTIDNDYMTGSGNSFLIDDEDHLHVVYYKSQAPVEVRYATNKSGEWVTQMIDNESAPYFTTSIAIDQDGLIHAVYYDDRPAPFKGTAYAHQQQDGSWTVNWPESHCTNHPIENKLAFVLDSNKNPHYFAYDYYGDQFYHYTQVDDYWTCVGLYSNDARPGYALDAVIDGRDSIFVSEYEETQGYLKLMTNNAKGNSWRFAKIDPQNKSGDYHSMKQGKSGYFYISYYDVTNRDLKFARFKVDADGDGYYNVNDCNDIDAEIYPGATEFCGDNIDNDCDGLIDEDDAFDPVKWYLDADGDGFGDPLSSKFACSIPSGYIKNNEDCDDSSASNYPDSSEVCSDLKDNDCDGNVDEGCHGHSDADDDGDGFTEDEGDCNDGNVQIYPDAEEICDGIDNDCDRKIDADDDDVADALTYYQDFDGDGFGLESTATVLCQPQIAWVKQSGDCFDEDSTFNPDAAEVCDGSDNNCDGQRDEETEGAKFWYYDNDLDGFGNDVSLIVSCEEPFGYTQAGSDCNDESAEINSSHAEICFDLIDNNCDGQIDEDGCVTAEESQGTVSENSFRLAESGGGCALSTQTATGGSLMFYGWVLPFVLLMILSHKKKAFSLRCRYEK